MAIGIQIEEELLHKEIFTILNADGIEQPIRSVNTVEEMGFPSRGSFLKGISEEQSGDPGELLQSDRELLSQKRPERTKGGENLETEA